MDLRQIKSVLESTGLPVVYDFWPEGAAPALPWICYREAGSNNLAADGIVFLQIRDIEIELYTRSKDPTSEAAVERALTDAGIYWEKSETYIETEHCFEVIYEIEV